MKDREGEAVAVLKEEGSDECRALLDQRTGNALDDARVVRVLKLASELGHPQAEVGLASAKLGGKEGWIVLDGERSRWFEVAEGEGGMDDEEDDEDEEDKGRKGEEEAVLLLKAHVGRQLLGLK